MRTTTSPRPTSTRGSGPRILARPGVAAVALGAALVVAVPAAAPASPGDPAAPTEDGYGVGVGTVSLEGDVSGALRASVPSPPPVCYWKELDFPNPGNPQAVSDYFYDEIYVESGSTDGMLAVFGGREALESAIEREKNGQDLTWYSMEIDESQLGPGGYWSNTRMLAEAGCGNGFSGQADGEDNPGLIAYGAFPAGDPPAPVIDPEVLAQYAYEVMDLVEPTLQWNPQIARLDQATFVNLETWFWVDDAEAVDERSVTATVGDVSATVTATTGGVTITSPAGTTQCTPEQARTEYAVGASSDGACTLTFARASYGYPEGFPMAASTDWEATWTSTVAGAGGELDGRTAQETTYVPVSELQTLGISVD